MQLLDSLVDMVQLVHGISRKVARHDRDLAHQMKRSSVSVALNGSEGLLARAGKRTSRLEDTDQLRAGDRDGASVGERAGTRRCRRQLGCRRWIGSRDLWTLTYQK
jgi:hypothetical protein